MSTKLLPSPMVPTCELPADAVPDMAAAPITAAPPSFMASRRPGSIFAMVASSWSMRSSSSAIRFGAVLSDIPRHTPGIGFILCLLRRLEFVLPDRVTCVPLSSVHGDTSIVIPAEPLGLTLGRLLRPMCGDDTPAFEFHLPLAALLDDVIIPTHSHSRSSSGSMPQRIDAASRKVISSYSAMVLEPSPWLSIWACVRR